MLLLLQQVVQGFLEVLRGVDSPPITPYSSWGQARRQVSIMYVREI